MKKLRFLIASMAFALFTLNANAQIDTLSNFGSYWKYIDSTVNTDSASWTQSSYNDANWPCSPSPIGYGDTWIVGCIHSGCSSLVECNPTCATKNITAWFRQKISVPNVNLYDSVYFDGLIDDGLIMYVNGTQVWSYNMPSSWNSSTWATNTISGGAETTLVHTTLPITHWISGNNVVSVELHQRGPTSSDFDLDGRFIFFKHMASSINSLSNNNQFSVYPNPSNGNINISASQSFSVEKSTTIAVYDITGRKVHEQELQFNTTKSSLYLPLSNGVYFLHIQNEGNTSVCRINILN